MWITQLPPPRLISHSLSSTIPPGGCQPPNPAPRWCPRLCPAHPSSSAILAWLRCPFLLLKACCDAVPALRAQLRAPLLPTSLGGPGAKAGAQKGLCGCCLPSKSWRKLGREKKAFRSPWDGWDLHEAALRNKGNLEWEQVWQKGCGQRGFVSMYPGGAIHCAQLQFVLPICLCHLQQADPAQLRKHLRFLRGSGKNHLSHVFLTLISLDCGEEQEKSPKSLGKRACCMYLSCRAGEQKGDCLERGAEVE